MQQLSTKEYADLIYKGLYDQSIAILKVGGRIDDQYVVVVKQSDAQVDETQIL